MTNVKQPVECPVRDRPEYENLQAQIEALLIAEIELAKPDEQLAFLECQVPRIAHDIVRLLNSKLVQKE
jgi:hypothetical protein